MAGMNGTSSALKEEVRERQEAGCPASEHSCGEGRAGTGWCEGGGSIFQMFPYLILWKHQPAPRKQLPEGSFFTAALDG